MNKYILVFILFVATIGTATAQSNGDAKSKDSKIDLNVEDLENSIQKLMDLIIGFSDEVTDEIPKLGDEFSKMKLKEDDFEGIMDAFQEGIQVMDKIDFSEISDVMESFRSEMDKIDLSELSELFSDFSEAFPDVQDSDKKSEQKKSKKNTKKI